VRRSRVHRPATIFVAVVAVTVATVGVGYGLARFIGRGFRIDFSSSDRRHLDQIPIDRANACGKVETIHEALGSFNVTYTAAAFGVDAATAEAFLGSVSSSTAPPTRVEGTPWPTVAAGVDASAQRLDLVLADGIPHFPPRVQHELTAIRESIAEGRALLANVGSAGALNQTRTVFERGRLHAGYASDLVGDQCPTPLGA
jgi:hypothetical protein